MAYRPKSRTGFWTEKFHKNRVRDRQRKRELLHSGWRVLIVWECAVRGRPDHAALTVERARRWLRSESTEGEIGTHP